MRELDDDRPHRKHCVCADCKADRDARYAALQGEAVIAAPAARAPEPAPAPKPVPPPPAPVARPVKRREPYAETRVRDRLPRVKVQPAPRPPVVVRSTRPAITKEDARCCMARRDVLGRPPIGYCSPECERRPR